MYEEIFDQIRYEAGKKNPRDSTIRAYCNSRTNRTIHVRESKSRRDRYTILSDRNLDILSRLKGLDAPAMIRLLYGKDVCKCTSCGEKMVIVPYGRYRPAPRPHLLC